jgi:hypothetical protein
MGKHSRAASILTLCTIILIGIAFWYIGLEQTYQQQQQSLKNFVQLLHASDNKISQEQQTNLATQQGFKLYRIIRNQDELISIAPSEHNLSQNIILQSLKQQDGFISTSPTSDNTVFYKHQINQSITLLASTSLAKARERYIIETQNRILTLLAVGLLMTLCLTVVLAAIDINLKSLASQLRVM